MPSKIKTVACKLSPGKQQIHRRMNHSPCKQHTSLRWQDENICWTEPTLCVKGANHPTSRWRFAGKHVVHESSNSVLHPKKCSIGSVTQIVICLNSSSNRLPYFVFCKRGAASSKNESVCVKWSPGSLIKALAT